MAPDQDQRQDITFENLFEVDVTIWGEWLSEPRTQDAVLIADRNKTGDFELYIRNSEGKIVKVKRIFAELDPIIGKR